MRAIARIAAAALALTAASSAEAQIRIAIVGDSVASGEGNPDGSPALCGPGSGSACSPFPRWDGRTGRSATPADGNCRRSTASGLLAAAEKLRADLAGIEAVIVETFACSGATTVGVAGQLTALSTDSLFLDAGTGEATGNRIDAIIMTAGANDIGFSGIVAACASPAECNRIFSVPTLLTPLTGTPTRPSAYATLGGAIRTTLPGRVGNVFIAEYYHPSKGPDDYCGATTAVHPSGPISKRPDFSDLPFFWGVSWFE